MRRLLILAFILTGAMILAHVQPRPVRAQTDDWWVGPQIGPTTNTVPCCTENAFGNWFIDESPILVPAGHRLVGWIITLVERNYGGSWGVDARWATHNITNSHFDGLSNGQSMCFLYYNTSTPLPYALPSAAAAEDKCAELAPYAVWRGLQWQITAIPGVSNGTQEAGIGGVMSGLSTGQSWTTIWRPIYFGEPPAVACFTPVPNIGTAPLTVSFIDCSTGPVTTWNWYIDDVLYHTGQEPGPNEFEYPGTYYVTLVVNENEYNEDSLTLPVVVNFPDPYVRPFSSNIEGVPSGGTHGTSFPLWTAYSFAGTSGFESGWHRTVLAWAKTHAPVYAAASGTVTSIRPMTSADCNASLGSCYALFGDDVSSVFDIFDGYVLEYLISDVFIVTIEIAPGHNLQYWVTNPTAYVRVGAVVNQGCALGESIPIIHHELPFSAIPNLLWQIFAGQWGLDLTTVFNWFGHVPRFQPPPQTEFTLMNASIVIEGQLVLLPVYNQLTEYAEDEPRACDYQPSACLNADPELKSPNYWTMVGGVDFFNGGGVSLNPGSGIYAQLSLDPNTNYIVEVWGRGITGTGRYSLQLGQTLQTFTVGTDFQQGIIPEAVHLPDLGLFYTLSLANTGTSPIFIQSICVREPGAGGYLPNTCYFANPSFDGLPASQGWSVSGMVNDGLVPGEIIMYDGDTISQNAQLYPNGVDPHIYFVTVTATVGGADFATLSADNTSDVGFIWSYELDGDDFVAPNSSNMYPVSGFFSGVPNGITLLPNYEIVFFAYVTVADFTNSPFTIEAVIDSTNPNLFLRVRHVCIDDPFSHHDEPDAWIPPPPFAPNCVGISPPQGNEVSAWTFYLWSNLDRFFKCDLMILLNKMHDTAQKAFTLMGWQMRYWQSVLMTVTKWLGSDLFGWLGGHFRNIAIGQVTTIESAPGATLWDVLLALINLVLGPIVEAVREIITVVMGIISQAVNLLLTLIQGIISFVLALLLQILNLLTLAQSLLASIIGSYNNATPTAIPGMPDCSINQQAHWWCIGMWILTNTIFSGTGAAIIPLITGIAAIHLLLWVVGEFRRTVLVSGQST